MILLLNYEAVIVEMMKALHARVVQQLQLDPAWVDVRLVRESQLLRFWKDAKVLPQVTIKLPSKDDPVQRPLAEELEQNPPDSRYLKLPPEEVQKELEFLTTLVRNEINIRLNGLDD